MFNHVKRVTRLFFAPLMMSLTGLGIWLIQRGYEGWTLGVLLMVAIAWSFAAERIVPYRPQWNEALDDRARDWAHFVVNEVANIASLAVLPWVAGLAPWPTLWPTSWSLEAQLMLAVLVFDAGATITHWASHHVPLLWRLHAVHHSIKRFYGLNGLMKHPLHQALEMAIGVTPLVAMGLPERVAALLALATAIQLLLQHSNVDYATGPFKYVLALNVGHRFHHLKWAGIGDVNFGLFTTCWDWVLGTWVFDAQRVFTSDDLGIAKEPLYPTSYWRQLMAPFRRARFESAQGTNEGAIDRMNPRA